MKIVDIQRWLIRMPFSEDILWASGRRLGATRIVVRITTDEGTEGWGETICLLDTVRAVFDEVVMPLARGYCVTEVERFTRNVLGAGYYHHKRAAVMACAAMEMAMWDAYGKRLEQPLHKLWGGAWRTEIPASAYLFLPDPVAVADKAKWFLDRGFTSFKAKIGFDYRTDIAVTEAVRRAVGDCELRVDVNGAWTPGTARRLLARLADYDLSYVEQPLQLDDLIGHAKLRECQLTPIALDESAYTLEDVVNIVRMEAADVLLLDPHEAGGCWQVIKQAGIAEAVGIPLSLHSGGEMGISQAAYLHLAASIPNMTISIDTERDYLADDIVAEPPALVDGRYRVPQGPGLGVEPLVEKLEQYSVDRIAGAYLDGERPGWFPVKPEF
ncbi:mandelate racemase/muconate lactonizing enzyme family protein [Microbulbifer sp. ALW1]|uniref:mandelate racemase/muconate lactonizing enzyme family protein n=1 Tax=Microbulbifer sp. (strain ALW1) TaxID=1516059 RepID=UPI0013575BF4|nr:mandelate racemase/muconate lactonizing enzyme family protein [Microbulbifer sp. ALW1]